MLGFLTAKITRKKLGEFISFHSSGKLTLDLGCSDSPYSRYFPNRIGFDVKDGDGVDVVGDAHSLPFEDGKFNVVLCTEVLEHLHSPHIAIAEMNRVLKKKGILILTTRFIFPIHDAPNDYFRYTKYGLKYLFRDWNILELKEETHTLETLAVLLQRIGYQTKLQANKLTKVIIFAIAKVITFVPRLLKKEYGNIEQSVEEKNILTSGYYLICEKK